MSEYIQKYIVQDIETGEFLYPEPLGSIGTTPYIKQAGHFYDYEDALEAAKDEISGPFSIFSFFVEKSEN